MCSPRLNSLTSTQRPSRAAACAFAPTQIRFRTKLTWLVMSFKLPTKRKRYNSVATSPARRSQPSSHSGNPESRIPTTNSQCAATPQAHAPRVQVIARQRAESATSSAAGLTEDSHVETEDLDSLSEIVMAVELRDHGTVGCAYYVAREEKLYLMEDVKLGGITVVDACKAFAALSSRQLTQI